MTKVICKVKTLSDPYELANTGVGRNSIQMSQKNGNKGVLFSRNPEYLNVENFVIVNYEKLEKCSNIFPPDVD